jgi:hypothetical protein
MKKIVTVVTRLAAILIGSAPMAAQPPATVGKGAMAPDDSATAEGGREDAASGRADQMLKKRQQDMLELHGLMHRIRDAKDPKEKSRLMDQHLQMLRDSWQEMKSQRRQKFRPPTRRGGQEPREFGPGGDADVGGDPP